MYSCIALAGQDEADEDFPYTPEVKDKILQYSEFASNEGSWLDVLDAAIVATNQNAFLQIILAKPDGKVDIFGMNAYFASLIPGMGYEDPSSRDRTSPKEWLFLSCNADFLHENGSRRNHWIPCVYREQVSDEKFHELTVQARSKVQKDISQATMALVKAEARCLEVGESDALAATILSLKQDLQGFLKPKRWRNHT